MTTQRRNPPQRDAQRGRWIAALIIAGLLGVSLLAALAQRHLGGASVLTAVLKASGQIEREPVRELRGAAYPYTLRFPGDAWYLRDAALAKRDVALADRWVMRPDAQANVLTVVEDAPGKVVFLDKYADVVLEAGAKQTRDFKVISRGPVATSPDDGRLVHVSFSDGSIHYERYYGFFTAGERGFQVMATAPAASFKDVEAELRGIIESFHLPSEAWTSGIPDDYEKEPAREVKGVAQAYTLTAPNDRWRVRKDGPAKQEQPEADRWIARPDRGAHLLVIAERLPGSKLTVDGYVDAVQETAQKAASQFRRVSVAPLASDPAHGRLLRTSVTLKGLELEYLYGIVVIGDRYFQMIGFAERAGFPGVEKDLTAIIESFRAPPEAAK